MIGARPRLFFLITEDWTFWELRLDLARAARDAGFEVSIATRVTDHGERIRKEGFRLIPIALVRRSRHPIREAGAIVQLVRLYWRERPHIVHHVAMKPIIYGSLAAWIARVPVVINAFAGLGYAFTDRQSRSTLLRSMVRLGLRTAVRLSRSVVVFQNREDRDLLLKEGVVSSDQVRIIAGSGVDTSRFKPAQPPEGPPIVMLAARMLWDKGIGEFVDAAGLLKAKGVSARFILVGRRDEDNPTAIAQDQLLRWVREAGVEWWAHREDMPAVLGSATIVVLPSYREGLPKVLLEAAACGKAIVATDVPGCHDIVRHQENGLLIPAKAPEALAAAIERLLKDPALRHQMGTRGREIVMEEYSVEAIVHQVLALYGELLEKRPLFCLSSGSS